MPHDLKRSLGEALHLVRVHDDLKQKTAAARLGLSTSYVSELEHGAKTPTMDVLDRYAAVFRLPVSSLLFLAEHLMREGSREYDLRAHPKVITMLAMRALT